MAFFCAFLLAKRVGGRKQDKQKNRKKRAFFECSCMRNFFITVVLELKIGKYNRHYSFYLCSHFQRYSYTYMEDICTKLVKSSVFPYILISTHLYLLGRDDSRAENSHGKHEHT